MISREEAERMLGKKISPPTIIGFDKRVADAWKNYVNSLFFPEIASKVLTKEALFVVHAGYGCRYNVRLYAEGKLEPIYTAYIRRLKSKVRSEIGRKSVVLWTEADAPNHNLDFLGIDKKSAILVPFEGNIILEEITQMGNASFVQELSKYIESCELVGEYRDRCVLNAELSCVDFMKTTMANDCIMY